MAKYLPAVAQSMGASFTSPGDKLIDQRGITYRVAWTGTPVGVFTFEVSNDSKTGAVGDGNWDALTISPPPTPASGAAGSFVIQFDPIDFLWIRLVYTRTSGTGTLDSVGFAKAPS